MTMSVNTLVWGFTRQWVKVIETLKDNNVIVPKCWVSRLWHNQDKLLEEKNILKESVFYSLKWTQKYKEEVVKYTNSVEFNQEVYDKVYAKLYLFIDHYSRHDFKYNRKSIHYYINQFNLLYHFFYGVFIKEQIQLVLIDCVPHLGVELIIYEIAKALNIETIIVIQSLTPNKFYYLNNIDDYGDFQFMVKREAVPEIKLEKKFFIDHFYMRDLKQYRFSFLHVIKETIKRPHEFFEHFACNYLRYRRAKQYKKNLSQIVSPVDYGKKYVYFPLHLQPEMTTSALGGVFCDQVLALELLSKKIPEDWVIHVKENPKQTEFMRDDAFFARLKLMDNVRVTPLHENTFQLIEHSQFVASITGTAGWEAICGGKPALVFGKAWYQNFEGVFKWRDDIDINEIANYQIDHAKLESDYNQLVSKMATGVVDASYLCLVENYDEDKNIQEIAKFLSELINEKDEKATLSGPTQKMT